MLRGDLGQSPGGWPEKLQRKALKGEKPITVRPGSLLPPANLDALRAEAKKAIDRDMTDQEFASYLMYPKVLTDFAAVQNTYSQVSQLPTPTYFYGMKVGEEISVDTEKGKTIILRLQVVGDVDSEGQVQVFFEVNGQQRIVRVPNRTVAAKVPVRRKASEAEAGHVAAPMPGVVSTVAVKAGQHVKAGDVLFTIEAMKMESSQHAAIDGTVEEVVVTPGGAVEAKDLVIILKPTAAAAA
jgi:pyruvate carboxylase